MTKKLLHGQTGWLGLITAPHPAGLTWRWDGFTAWDGDQPDTAAFARRSPQAYGPVSGGEFDDYTRDMLGLASLTVGYALGSIVSIQVGANAMLRACIHFLENPLRLISVVPSPPSLKKTGDIPSQERQDPDHARPRRGGPHV
jgi:hypothetical protein